ncbi:MAG: hypothetical protein JSW00_09830 [Thermoplasmata archaeon]|nr:MAG: hypothetical protein JSW00_09830 [Thermoplasmata archaeon]
MIGNINNKKSMAIGVLLLLGFLSLSCITNLAKGVPVIHEEDSYGSWEDTFNDTTGIALWDNIETCGYGLKLMDMFYDNFTGLEGDPPDALKWDIFDEGYVLWKSGNILRVEANPPGSSWRAEMIQTNDSFTENHTLTWSQVLQTVTSGMYYHFYISNATDGSWLLCLYQNSAGQYMVWNNITSSGVQIGTSVTGWHDYKVVFTDGFIEFYYDGVKEHEYDFQVDSVRYRFGILVQSAWTRSPLDEIHISSGITTGNLTSSEITLPSGYTWDSLYLNKTVIGDDNFLNATILDGVTYQPILGYEHLTGANIDISGIDEGVHPTIRLRAHFVGNGTHSPYLSGWKVLWTDTIAPEKPTGFTVSDPRTGNSLILDWNPNIDPDIVNYVLYYSLDNSTFIWLANVILGSESFTHYGLSTHTTYYYKIAAADEMPNQSPFSDVSSGIPDIDTDCDGIGNLMDGDDDGDTVLDSNDDFPLNPNENIDTDGDGIGNHADYDDDDDSYLDVNDEFPLNDTEWLDTDHDGVGNNMDPDDDNDGVPDISDPNPLSNINDLDAKIDALLLQISTINASLQSEILGAESDILGKIDEIDNADILTHLKETNVTLYYELQNLLDSITDEVIEINNSLSHQLTALLLNMTDDNDALRIWLEIILNELNTNLTATNDFLDNQLKDIQDSNQRLSIIRNTLDDLLKLDNILSNITLLTQTLQDVNDDLSESIEDKSKEEDIEDRVQFLELLIILVLILGSVNLILSVLVVMLKKSEPKDLALNKGPKEGEQTQKKDLETSRETSKSSEKIIEEDSPPPPPPPPPPPLIEWE